MPARGGAGLFLGGEYVWRPGWPPRPEAGLLSDGFSSLLPPGHAGEADQLAPVPGGVVAHISDLSTGATYGALGRVVFIPAVNAPVRVIAWATMIAVSPDGRRVWVQTAVQSMRNGVGVSASFTSPTWAVDLTGRRASPVLHLPLGLAGATAAGPLTLNLVTGRVQLWNGATGQPVPINLPAGASFVAAGRDRVIWSSRHGSGWLHVTDPATGTDATYPLPRSVASAHSTPRWSHAPASTTLAVAVAEGGSGSLPGVERSAPFPAMNRPCAVMLPAESTRSSGRTRSWPAGSKLAGGGG